MPAVQSRLVSAVHAIEELEDERHNLSEEVSAILKGLKDDGYEPKIVRKVIALRRKSAAQREEEEQLIDTYFHALETELAHGTHTGNSSAGGGTSSGA